MKSLAALLVIAAAHFATPAAALQTSPQPMLPLFQQNPTSPADLAVQSRRFHTVDRQLLLDAAAAILQDMGYTLTDTSAQVGSLGATRRAEVEGAGAAHAIAEAAVVTLSLLLSVATGEDMVTDLPEQVAQLIYLSLLIEPDSADTGWTTVRLSIDRDMIYDNGNTIPDHTELPLLYSEFFERLSRAVFLEAELR